MGSFIPSDFRIQLVSEVESLFQQLIDRPIQSAQEFEVFLSDVSDLESFLSENMAWRYIHMTCDTQNETFEKDYLYFVQEIQPKIAPFEDQLNQKNCGLSIHPRA